MQPRVPHFTFDGRLTEAGQQVINFLNEKTAHLGNGATAEELNHLAGHHQYYWTQVKMLKQFSDVQFAESFGNLMRYAWDDMQYFHAMEAQQKKTDDTASKTNVLEESLALLKEELLGEVDGLKKQISALKGENTKLRNQIKGQDDQDADENVPETEAPVADVSEKQDAD